MEDLDTPSRVIEFDDKTLKNPSIHDERRKLIAHIIADPNGRHGFEVYDLSNCVPREVYRSLLDAYSFKQATERAVGYINSLPLTED